MKKITIYCYEALEEYTGVILSKTPFYTSIETLEINHPNTHGWETKENINQSTLFIEEDEK